MLRQSGRLMRWALLRNPLRTFFLVLTVVGSMSAFSTTEATLRDLSNRANDIYRRIPYDLEVAGEAAFDYEPNIVALAGVSATERTNYCSISVNAMKNYARVQLGEGQLQPVKYTEGRAPEQPDEIAITPIMAELGRVALGGTVEVAWFASSTDLEPGEVLSGPVVPFIVCGIATQQAGSSCLLTEAGLQRIHANPSRTAMLLVKTDGSVNPGAIATTIREMGKSLRITVIDESDNPMLGLATTLSQTISLIMLLAGVGSFYMLLSLSQRERLYDLGVLRAVGFSSATMTIQLILEGLLLLVFGALLGGVLVFSVTSAFHLGNVNTTLAQNLQPMQLLFALFLAVIVYSAIKVGGQSATKMLRGER